MMQPEELSAYKESVLQDIAQAQRVGADENAITALISQYPLDQALAARLARCYGPKGLENFNLDGIDVAALPSQQKHVKEPDQSVLQQVWEEHVALVMDQVCRMSPEYLDLERETRLDILLLEQARAGNNLQAMLGLEILHVAEDLNLAMQEAEAAEAGHAAGQPGACKMAAFARKIIHSLERQRESLEQAAELLPLVCDAQAYAAAAQTYARNKKDKDGLPEDGFRQTMQAQRQSLEAAARDCTPPCLGDLFTARHRNLATAEEIYIRMQRQALNGLSSVTRAEALADSLFPWLAATLEDIMGNELHAGLKDTAAARLDGIRQLLADMEAEELQ